MTAPAEPPFHRYEGGVRHPARCGDRLRHPVVCRCAAIPSPRTAADDERAEDDTAHRRTP